MLQQMKTGAKAPVKIPVIFGEILEFNSICFANYSTVTDFAKLRG